jgi:hypothetical protein
MSQKSSKEELLARLIAAVQKCVDTPRQKDSMDLCAGFLKGGAQMEVEAAVRNCMKAGIPNENIRKLLQPLVESGNMRET